MGKPEEDQSAKVMHYIKSIVLGGLIALVVCLLYLIVVAIGISKGLLGMDMTYQFTLLGCVVGGFMGSRWAIKRCVVRALVVGLVVGVVLFLLVLTVGVIAFGGRPEYGGIGLLCACLCGGAVSGFIGNGRKRKKKRRK